MKLYRDKLNKIRKRSGLSVKYIAQKLDIATSTYWAWERGSRIPSYEKIIFLSKILSIEPQEVSDIDEISTDNTAFSERKMLNSYPLWQNFTEDREKEILQRQQYALKIIQDTNLELNKVWYIVQAIMKAVDVGIYIKDKNGDYLATNETFKKRLNLKKSFHVAGKTDFDFFPLKDAKYNDKEDRNVIKDSSPIFLREGYIPGSRKQKWGLISKYPIKDRYGIAMGVIGIFTDITEKKKMESFKSLTEAALKKINEIVHIRKKEDGETIFISDSIARIAGYPLDFFSDVEFYDQFMKILHPDDKEKEMEYFRKQEFPETRELRIYSADGKILWLESSTVVFAFNGCDYNCSITRDITNRKQEEYNNRNNLAKLTNIEKKLLEKGVSKEVIDYALNH